MLEKICSKCQDTKPESDYYINSQSGKPRHICKPCYLVQSTTYREANKEKKNTSDKLYRKNNLEKIKDYAKQYYNLNKHKYTAASSRRRAIKVKALRALSSEEQAQIDYLYWLAKDLSIVGSGQAYHVDHIVPLQGETVCGFHTPSNLQILPGDINLAKNNKFPFDITFIS